MHQIGQRFGCRRSGVHGLDPVVVGFGQKSVGGVHQKTLALAFAAAMAVSPKLLRVEKSCVWFAVMIIFANFRALDILWHGRGEELQCLRAGLLKSKWCGRPIASALLWVSHSCGDHLIQPVTDSQQFGRGFASGLNLHQEIEQGGGAGSAESLCHPFLRRVCGRGFWHNFWREDFPAFADEGVDDALVGFGAGGVVVAEMGGHGG